MDIIKKFEKIDIRLKILLFLFIPLCFGGFIIKEEYFMILRIFLSIGLLGLSTFPFIYTISKTFKDKGYFISKSIGILINSFIVFLVSSLNLLKYENFLIYGIIILVSIPNWFLIFPKIKKEITKEEILIWIKQEILFLFLLTLFSYVRGFKNEIGQTEKYMDYGIIMSCYKAKHFPIEDMWMNGRFLNYYYYGQYILSYLIKFSRITVQSGYNICLSVIIAMSSINLGSIFFNVLNKFENSKLKIKLFSIFSVLFTFFAANGHYLIYGLILYLKDKSYVVYDSTRYIGYKPDVADKTIHEFPIYGFLLGDAHAYTINTIFVIGVLYLLFLYFFKEKKSFKEYFIDPIIILLGFFIGNFQMINYWDFPIYFIVSGAIILFTNIYKKNIKSKYFWLSSFFTLLQGVEILIISFITSYIFSKDFRMISSEIKLCQNHSLPHQLLVLWGIFLFIFIVFLISFFLEFKNIQENFKKLDIAIILIALCGFGLVFLPEVIYIKDIYENGYARANTMFKLTYQAFILLSISSTYFCYRLLQFKTKILGYLFIIVLLLNTTYVYRYLNKDYGNIFNVDYYDGLDGTRYLSSFSNGEYHTIKYINENIEGRHTILEASGLSYSTFNKISAFTSNPTIYGWHTHEHLWNNAEEKDERIEAINTIYTSDDLDLTIELLKKYNVEYIFIGDKEFEQYNNDIKVDKIFSLGKLIYTKKSCKLIKIDQEKLY